MNFDVKITLDLSPAFERALGSIVAAFKPQQVVCTGPHVVVEKPAPASAPERNIIAEIIARAERPAPPPPAPAVEVSPVADVEVAPEADTVVLRRVILDEERKALLARDYAAGVSRQELLRRLNALPGPPMDGKALSNAIFRNGLQRPEKPRSTWLPPHVEAPPAPEISALHRAVAGSQPAVDDATIRHWASQRGLCNGGEALDLERINRKRFEHGLPAFVRRNGLRDSSATLRGPAVEDAR